MLSKPEEKQVAISPELWDEMQKIEKYIRQQEFLTVYNIKLSRSSLLLSTLCRRKRTRCSKKENSSTANLRAVTPEIKEEYKTERKKLSDEIVIVREYVATANDIEFNTSRLVRIFNNANNLEAKEKIRNKEMQR